MHNVRNRSQRYDKVYFFSGFSQELHNHPNGLWIKVLCLLALVAASEGIHQWWAPLDPTV